VKLIVSPEADLGHIEEYIGEDNPKAAVAFVARLTARFDGLATFPGIGRKRDEIRQGYRSVAEGEYIIIIIIYRVQPDAVEILHVVHGNKIFSNNVSRLTPPVQEAI
jgi:toxin ParE1/3/4